MTSPVNGLVKAKSAKNQPEGGYGHRAGGSLDGKWEAGWESEGPRDHNAGRNNVAGGGGVRAKEKGLGKKFNAEGGVEKGGEIEL